MRALETPLPGVPIREPRVFADERGELFGSDDHPAFQAATGLDCAFVRDNPSHSGLAVLRGLPLQRDEVFA